MESGKHSITIILHSAHLTVQFVYALLDTDSSNRISAIIFHLACLTFTIHLHFTGHGKWKTCELIHVSCNTFDMNALVQSHVRRNCIAS
jgi:hypothetical protein